MHQAGGRAARCNAKLASARPAGQRGTGKNGSPVIVPPIPGAGAASRRALLLLAAALPAGCGLETTTPEPGILTPTRFRAAPAAEPAAAPDPAWWRGFGTAELVRLMDGAMAANLDIAAASARLRQADAQVRVAGAALLPVVDADASVARSRSVGRTPDTVGQGRETYGATLSASYEIDFWGRNRAILASARSSVAATRYAAGVVALNTQSSVANAYFALLAAREQLAIQRGNIEVATRNLAILRQRLSVGTATGLDIAQQETVLATQRAAVPPLQQAADQNLFALATLTGVTPDRIAVGTTRLAAVVVPAIAPGLPAEVLQRRPDIGLAEANLAAASASVTAARAALYPTIALTAQGGLQSLALRTLLNPGSSFYSIAAGLAAPIFDGGRRRAQLEQARGREAELLAEYRRAILAALQDTETGLSALRRNSELVALQSARVNAAQQAYNVAEAQFRAGTVDLLTVLTVQTNLFVARNALAQAQAARLQSAAALFTALGGGWTADALRPGGAA